MKKLATILEKKKIIKAHEANELGVNNMTLLRLSEIGEIQKLGAGIYAHNSLDFLQACALAVSKYYPEAVISNASALSLYDLALEKIYKIDVDIPYQTSIRNELLEVHRVSSKIITEVVTLEIEGHNVKIYSKRRCLYEAYKLYGQDLELYRVIKRFTEKYKDEIDAQKLENLDQLFKVNIRSLLAQEMSSDFF